MKVLVASRFMICVLTLFLGLVVAASCSQTAQKVQIADGSVQFITAPDGYVPNGNSLVMVNDNHVLVFDTFIRPCTARAELAEIRKITDKPVRYLVNSHWHPDHWSRNEVFAQEFPNLEILGPRKLGDSC